MGYKKGTNRETMQKLKIVHTVYVKIHVHVYTLHVVLAACLNHNTQQTKEYRLIS